MASSSFQSLKISLQIPNCMGRASCRDQGSSSFFGTPFREDRSADGPRPQRVTRTGAVELFRGSASGVALRAGTARAPGVPTLIYPLLKPNHREDSVREVHPACVRI